MKKLTLFILIMLIGFSCKKKKTTEPTNTSSGSTTGTPATAAGINASFNCTKNIYLTNGIVTSDNFSSYAFAVNSSYQFISMGNVSLNGVQFKFNSPTYLTNQYKDTTTTNQYTIPNNWEISGTSAITSFSFANTIPYPVYNDYTIFADTFDITSGLTIPLENTFSGADEINASLLAFDTNFNMQYTPQHIYTSTDKSIFFTNDELAALGQFTQLRLTLTFKTKAIQNMYGKQHLYTTGLSIYTNLNF